MRRREDQRDSENWIEDARRRLAGWRVKKPETKAGQVRALWPEIEVALQDGQTLKSLRLWLQEEAGVSLTSETLRSYLKRFRKRDIARRVPATQCGPRSSAPGPQTGLPETFGYVHAFLARSYHPEPLQAPGDEPSAPDDPMAIAREALSKPRFDIRKIHGDGDPRGQKLI